MAYSLSQWAEATWWGTVIRQSTWGFAGAAVVLLFGLVLLLGGVFLMSLRLFGLVMPDRPVSEVATGFRRWTLVGLAMTLVAGPTMWAGSAIRYYNSGPFRLEMEFLAAAIVFHFTIYERVTRRDNASAVVRRFTGAVALVLWFGVGVAGRAIGFF